MPKCFLICPIGEEGTETRRISDIVLNYIVSPVCKEYGYEVIRSDTEFTVNSINDDIFSHLDNDELAIADLTGHNPNVFYEAGYRKAKGLPLIHIAKEGTVLPFDIKAIRTYFYGIEADKVEKAKEALRKVIEGISNNGEIPDMMSNNKDVHDVNKSEKHQDTFMTKECRIFFSSLYKIYSEKRKNGVERSKAIIFPNSRILSDNLGVPFDDVECCSRELHNLGFLKCFYADNIVLTSILTNTGIKYGEDNFYEPTYMQLLQNIVELYEKQKKPVPSNNLQDFNYKDMSILLSEGYIVQTSKYLNGVLMLKPTSKGIAKLAKEQ